MSNPVSAVDLIETTTKNLTACGVTPTTSRLVLAVSSSLLTRLEETDRLFLSTGPTAQLLQEYDSLLGALLKENAASHAIPRVYYKKGIIEITLGRELQAVLDFRQCLVYDPHMAPARSRLLRLLLELGRYDELATQIAAEPLLVEQAVLDFDKFHHEVQFGVHEMSFLKDTCPDSAEYVDKCTNLLGLSPLNKEVHQLRLAATLRTEREDFLSLVLDDLTALHKLEPNVLDHTQRLSSLYLYGFSDFENAKLLTAKCLRNDNEYKPCQVQSKVYTKFLELLTLLEKVSIYYSHLDVAEVSDDLKEEIDVSENEWAKLHQLLFEKPTFSKAMLRQLGLTREVTSSFEFLRDTAHAQEIPAVHNGFLRDLTKAACEAHIHRKEYKAAKPLCQELYLGKGLPEGSKFFPAHVPKIDLLLKNQKYDQAAALLNEFNARVKKTQLWQLRHEPIVQHQKQQQQQQHFHRQQQQQQQQQYQQPLKPKHDYYKILGVPRTADDTTIRKAYRDMTKKFHPDKYRGDATAEQIEEKMTQINHAYEVLGDKDLRARYDKGEDPNDPEAGRRQQTQHHQNPFAGGGFGGFGGFGGNSHFKFQNMKHKKAQRGH
ncbi:hypothetical protein BABINDRAFT_14101 [Babjeviella inositovora NRRL Y-12698]|uniref:J domain-containing protein n=1 Tax=Babjeviella inositovora NRRL Y-12698 TaxID=984486 RepID=A0A1E3QN38_9ASCO|nr:uncharacterized protein BABINDRAFT_14101 [Babjeviella inositovora NRRL Y-12698]ODQ79105.1 hypothetical protein BABINDRAFT_14101 [Babjeviella inositovora NRRL Y-12698]